MSHPRNVARHPSDDFSILTAHIASTGHHVYQPSAVLGNLIAGRKVEDTPLLVLVRDDSVREDMVNYDIFGCTWLLRDHAKSA